MIGEKTSSSAISAYAPSKPVADFTAGVQKDYGYGNEILHRPWQELNNRSVIEDMNRGQRTFNAFVDEGEEDPAEAWKWRGTRSKARNKATALHAQLTAGYIFPSFLAQNEDDEEDRDFSEMMDNSVEWLGHNSNYKSSFLAVSMGMLVNPVTYLGAEWNQVYQTVKERTDEGLTKREILDEVLSGYNAPVYSADQVLIANAYDQNIQRHRFNITRKFIEYGEAEARYGWHPYFEHVQPGVQTFYSDDDGLFYDIKDEDHPTLVEEVTYKNRRDDTEVCFVNGIYMGRLDDGGSEQDIEHNPMRHRDNRGAPKYNLVPFGYHRITEHFFFYKSLMASQYWDNRLIDAQYELAMNRAFLEANMPMGFSGVDDKIDSEVIFPSATITFKNDQAKAFPLLQPGGAETMFRAMRETEASMDESSLSETSAGQLPPASTKATAIAVAENNARKNILGTGKTLAESMVQYGSLMADIVVNNLSTAEVDELVGENTRLKYRTLLLKAKVVDGRQVDKVIRFDEALLGMELSDDEMEEENLKLLEEAGYPHNKKHIYRVNPQRFSMMKYLCRIEPEEMFPRNEEWMQAIGSQVYAQFAANPFVDLEALTRKTLYSFYKGDTDDLMKKQEAGLSMLPSLLGGGDPMAAGAPPQTTFGQQAQNKATQSTVPAATGLLS